ncbi:MAG: hypothetical protein ABI120_03310 [Gemmatimonadaceae bacterium]
MMMLLQDSTQTQAQTQRDSATTATTAMPMPEMRTPENVGYLQSVYVEVVLIFGGYVLLQYRRNVKLRQRQERFRHGR